MKIKVKNLPYEEVLALPDNKRKKPKNQDVILRYLLKFLGRMLLIPNGFKCKKDDLKKLVKNEPCLILMNHSCFTDLMIAVSIFSPRKLNIVCTSDGFVGKERLMRGLGCVPTQKFVTDIQLVKDIIYCIKTLKSSVLMYPEASYSFDGTATVLPESLGKLVKKLQVPVIMISTKGAFLQDPLYNNLQKRKVKISAEVKYLLSADDIENKSVDEINEIIKNEFTFDNFRYQQENNIKITESFRADYLHRVLYKCPHCLSEFTMNGSGDSIICNKCSTEYHLTETGFLECKNNVSKFSHIPDWYNWQRECVKKEIINNTYNFDSKVKIMVLKDFKNIYDIGYGKLTHSLNGFTLRSDDSSLEYTQSAKASYSLYSDFYWYSLGDVICIGNNKMLYYCFPENSNYSVAKARLAAEELYKSNQ
jgi:1-acyl-sn-glycerol-3-phosphate acyltransferase